MYFKYLTTNDTSVRPVRNKPSWGWGTLKESQVAARSEWMAPGEPDFSLFTFHFSPALNTLSQSPATPRS